MDELSICPIYQEIYLFGATESFTKCLPLEKGRDPKHLQQ